jgi:hypothetical protein
MSSCIVLLCAASRVTGWSLGWSPGRAALLSALWIIGERDSGLYGHASLPLLTPDRGIAVDRLFSLLFEPLSNSLANTLSWVGLGCRGQKRSAKNGISMESRRRRRLQRLRKCCYSSAVFVTVSVSPSSGSSMSKIETGRAGRRRTNFGTDVSILVVVMDRNRSLRDFHGSFGDLEELWAGGGWSGWLTMRWKLIGLDRRAVCGDMRLDSSQVSSAKTKCQH